MGGFATPLGHIAEEAGEKLAPTITRAISENIAPMESAFKKSKAGSAILDRWNQVYRPEVESNTATLTKAAQTSGALKPPHEIRIEARNTARAAAFGAKDEGLAFLLNAAKKEKGDNHANVLADHLGVLFHDAAYQDGKHIGQANTLSRNLKKAASASKNEGGGDFAKDSFLPKNPAPYKAPKEGEAIATRYARAAVAPFSAIPHSVSSLVTFMSDGAKSYTKALFHAVPFVNYENSRALLKMSNAMSELHMNEYQQHYFYQQSKFKKVLNDKFKWVPDSVGEIIHSNFSMPGMSGLRQWNLTVAGMSAKYQAEEMAARVMGESPGGYAESELRRFKLNPDKIRAQGGHLDKDDLRTAIFHGADYSAFLENSMGRSRASQASMAGRMMFAFHTYTSRSSRAVAGSIWKEIANKNPTGIARTIGTLALIAPEIGNSLQFIEDLAHGKSVGQSSDDWKHEEHDIWGQEGYMSALSSRVNALSHIGAWGVATGYTRALARHKLASAAAGALPNTLMQGAEDLYQMFFLNHDWKPVARDVMDDIPTAGIGQFAKHKVLPTKREEAYGRAKTAKQIKSAQTRARHKATD